jgi:hypothetical protein
VTASEYTGLLRFAQDDKAFYLSPLFEDHRHRSHHEGEAGEVVPVLIQDAVCRDSVYNFVSATS